MKNKEEQKGKAQKGAEWIEFVFSIAMPIPLFATEETKEKIGQEIKNLLDKYIDGPKVITYPFLPSRKYQPKS